MQTIKVPITGINRAVDEGIATDGQCMELINARIKNGSVEPISKPIELGELPISNVTAVYWHDAAQRYIAVATGGVYSLKLTGSNWTASIMSAELTGATDVRFLGNVAIFTMSDRLLHVIWRGEEDGYDMLGDAPDLPTVYVADEVYTSESVYNRAQLYLERSATNEDHRSVAIEQTLTYSMTSTFMQIRQKLAKRGYFAGTNIIMMRYAFRTPDGSYIKHSPVTLLCSTSNYSMTFPSKYPDDPNSENTYIPSGSSSSFSGKAGAFYALYGQNEQYDQDHPERHYEFSAVAAGWKPNLAMTDFSGLVAWEGFVVGVDVFICPIFNYKMVEFTDAYESGSEQYKVYGAKTAEEINEEIISQTDFYRVAEFDLKGNKVWELEDVTLDTLVLQQKLTDDQFSRNTVKGGCTYVYNNKLHVGNLSETFFNGYDWTVPANGIGTHTVNMAATVYTTISTNEGTFVVSNASGLNAQQIHPFLSYPDSRATTMVISTTVDGSTYNRRINLTPHRTLNLSYSFEDGVTINDIDEIVTTGSVTHALLLPQVYISTTPLDVRSGATASSAPTVSAVQSRPNVIKVSELSNPIFFPASHTYTPSNGQVIGMCANTQAISQGQFGSFPLYAFCSDGIYAMQVGSGSVAYASIAPVSRDVCVSQSSICGIDSAVVFASERGLMAISGAQTRVLSQAVDGWLPSTLNSVLDANDQETNILQRIAAIPSMATALSTTEFQYYIEGAQVAYNYPEHELIVNNASYGYAYVYGMDTGQWYKIAPGVDFFVRRYPECYAVRDGEMINLYNQHRSVSKMLLMTRPIKMGTESNKRILQAALRGVVKSAMSDLYLRGESVLFRDESLLLFSECGFYVLGSKDGEQWVLLVGKDGNAQVQNFRDLVMGMNKSRPFKYFMVAFIGGVRSDVAINYVEFTADEAFGNRLR